SSVISTLLDPSTKLETFYETDPTRPIDKLKTFRQLMKLSENRRESETEIDELEAYLSLPHESGTDPLSDHLALKVTNASCERVFSGIKDTINFNLASGGLEETVKASLLLKSWFEEVVIE
ncbi:21900_t:CDS:2, partial [Gigaspora rosea]